MACLSSNRKIYHSFINKHIFDGVTLINALDHSVKGYIDVVVVIYDNLNANSYL